MKTIAQLIEAVHREALRAPFPIDLPVYERAGRDPHVPIFYAGSLDAAVCVVGRDLGKDEVAAGQPLIGAGGRLVRVGLYRAVHGDDPPASDRKLESVLEAALLTNTVPFKPPGNKAYAGSVRERFRPFLAELIAAHWRGGDRVVTLGTEAFRWFAPYAPEPDAFEQFWRRDDRYEAEIGCTVRAETEGRQVEKRVTLLPLPHPSPLNQRWYKQFPALLDRRLASLP
jgi:uracil-DNA glycosylase